MDPLRLTPGQWRALLFLGAHSASASRAGYRVGQLCKLAPAEPADLPDLAAAGYVEGMHPDPARRGPYGNSPTLDAVTPQMVKDGKLRLYLTASGKTAADLLYGANQVVTHLHLSGSLPVPLLQHDAGAPLDLLTRLHQRGLIQVTPGEHLGWTEGFKAHVYRLRAAGDKEEHPCQRCGTLPARRLRIWENIAKPAERYCHGCIPDKATVYGAPAELVSLTRAGRAYIWSFK
ncbi:unnamed protein product [[Actinomadura] parvosata subsp. kistnae]|uniref:Uncharacterized protein n=1 Tax=[Actinomadura] parvosata subsp. kistnae TaxID=1909395 RepID=A0A1V0AAT0_9ACTN|nr:hypothetical protein [Nonomuraea sp. ATCC 55076]AQZ67252.1 hypothetical protein BKM31_42535 [Nonomuraea sp. ATCC 55076]SPL94531.1 unnamed protein product [Actinomadura parvosata subsp. kistnae]